MNEETEDENVEAKPEDEKLNLVDLIMAKPGGPSKDIIDKWKAKYGAIYASGFSEDELYVWRAISRSEYKQIQINQAKLGQIEDPEIAINESMASEEKIVSMCLLWPKKTPEELAQDKGGTVPTLLEQVMANSNFMTPQQASFLVVKL